MDELGIYKKLIGINDEIITLRKKRLKILKEMEQELIYQIKEAKKEEIIRR